MLQRNELSSSDELRDLEMELVRTSYLHGRNPDVGKESLHRLLAYDAASSVPDATRIESLLQMADWDLLFADGRSESDAALATYEAAYRELEEAETARASIEGTFSATRKNLVRVIARSTFRPRLTAGRVEESSPVVVRYYLDHWRTVRSMSGARAQLGGPSANCGSVSVISNHGAFDAT